MCTRNFPALILSGLTALGLAHGIVAGQARPSLESQVDEVFSRWTDRTPGCAVGVRAKGGIVLEQAYGMADLEHNVRSTAETIFEAGSVSKQFTAAAVLLLARDGKLSLDDPVRKHIPELPDYGVPLTIRHMLTHTSGLRDWGTIAAIGGWPRTTRVYTHGHVLDIASRQKSLNFRPGTRWSYSNTGYNLAAVIVSRVSGMSFAEFSRARIFDPLRMTRTSWRDDFTRVVENRATAYAERGGSFSIDMPFENVHGNGGLLTTVGDLLRWTANFASPVVGDSEFVREEQEPGRFSDGRRHDYAFGLRIAPYRDVREVGHSGATAGYRAYLADYPDRSVAVAVLCNVSSGNASQYAHAVADLYLGLPTERPQGSGQGRGPGAPDRASSSEGSGASASSPTGEAALPPALGALMGVYASEDSGIPLRIVQSGASLAIERGSRLQAESEMRFTAGSTRTLEFGADGSLRVIDQFGSVEHHRRVPDRDLTPRPLADYEGSYVSDEAEVSYNTAVDGESLVLKRRPDVVLRLVPVYRDAFRGPLGMIRFHRDAEGRVSGFSVSQDRVWNLRFTRSSAS